MQYTTLAFNRIQLPPAAPRARSRLKVWNIVQNRLGTDALRRMSRCLDDAGVGGAGVAIMDDFFNGRYSR